MTSIQPFDMVLFGGTGDLVMRKLLPALYHQHKDGCLPEQGRILCLGRSQPDQATYLGTAEKAARQYLGDYFSDAHWITFSSRLVYLKLDAQDKTAYAALADKLNEFPEHVRVFYLATAPNLFAGICENLAAVNLNKGGARVVLEKPLGHDLASSQTINAQVGKFFKELQIYRIDHYLGKEAVQNLLALRFSNTFFEPLWRREWIRDVQITVTEQVGVESRGDFYDKAGALRDMVQNHLLQLLCFIAMEPPASADPDAVRDEKLKVLRALRRFGPQEVTSKTVRGQYKAGASQGKPAVGYLDETGISPNSKTETFVALKAEIDTWRWAGVPFYLRTGKRMQERQAEIVINFRQVPHSIFPLPAETTSNRLVIQLQPEESVKMYLLAKQPGDQMKLKSVHLDLDFDEMFKARRPDAYERLLTDVIRGRLTLFMRRDELDEAWKWVEPILDTWEANDESPKQYTAGTWGPAASSALLSRDGFCWHEEG
ncbi:glucose-6-phosphate dehydrogenase [Chitinimonas sp. BJB300]|uniref:glucose-6-phosphate dehydrogenase n=1 Tax=Chitinimonas sp. BJB300 TaxID=1559339 RepID=UPI000C0EB5CC|nr:glucose-6-phosphate dehydrogenase [Chitinimonas sp. BJB300]PHV11841.1 glucose-6-phosphate dehydrogenase [Chitinimonas sp. BJB300]TSJ88633.1 glucose-6-phosphate dehydrogenase [Chitinimonas sp. BJB300]